MIRDNFLELCLSEVTCGEFISALFVFFLAEFGLWVIIPDFLAFLFKAIKKKFKSKGDKK